MNEDREHLDALLKTPGWLLFLAYAKQEWGPAGYGRKVKHAIKEARDSNGDVTVAVSNLDAANDAINDLLTWPSHQVQMWDQTAAREKAEPSLRRGGQA